MAPEQTMTIKIFVYCGTSFNQIDKMKSAFTNIGNIIINNNEHGVEGLSDHRPFILDFDIVRK